MTHTILIRVVDKNGIWLKVVEIPSHAEIVLENIEAAQHRMHLTAFGARLAWLSFGFILLLAMVLVIIGGR